MSFSSQEIFQNIIKSFLYERQFPEEGDLEGTFYLSILSENRRESFENNASHYEIPPKEDCVFKKRRANRRRRTRRERET